LKKHNTVKLFYNEYANKLVLRNQLAHLFREKQWAHTKNSLDRLQREFETGNNLEWVRGQRVERIDVRQFQEAQILFNELYRKDDIKIRVENPRMQVYSNDYKFLERLSSKVFNCLELWSISDEVELLPENTIVLERPTPYEYRVTLASWTHPELANWIENNLDKIKIGSRCLNAVRNNHYTQGLYFYVLSERYLSMLQLVSHKSIQRVDKIIYKQNLDK